MRKVFLPKESTIEQINGTFPIGSLVMCHVKNVGRTGLWIFGKVVKLADNKNVIVKTDNGTILQWPYEKTGRYGFQPTWIRDLSGCLRVETFENDFATKG